MSCRHDLAITTCAICYPETGTIFPSPDNKGESMDGPGAIPAPVKDRQYDLFTGFTAIASLTESGFIGVAVINESDKVKTQVPF